MSSISKLKIQGIRSFGPDTPQKIEFYSPVTFILGPNGTGKTTIIECLKYATTGELPSGAKLAQEVEVKAKVALEFNDITRSPVIVSRILSATQKDAKKSSTMKTIDSSMKFQNKNGEVVSMSAKGADIEREMVSRMGVSKAVLENVIFCHQEEANWPLQEGKSVKQKFDDLFASARYVKALEAVRKAKLEQDQNTKTYSAELKHLKKNLDDEFKTKEDKNSLENKLEESKSKLEVVNSRLDPITIEIENNRERYAEILSIQSVLKQLKSQDSELKDQISNLKSRIKNIFQGSDQDLKQKLDNSEEGLAELQLTIKKIEKETDECKSKIKVTEATKSQLLINKAELDLKKKEIEELDRKKEELVKNFFQKFGDDDDPKSASFNDKEADQVLEKAQTKYESQKKNYTFVENKIQSDVDGCREDLARLQQNLENLHDQKRNLTVQLAIIKRKIENNSNISENIDRMKKELEKAINDLEEIKESKKIQLYQREIESLKDEKKSIKMELEKLEKLITTYQSDMKNIQELNIVNKKYDESNSEVEKLLDKHRSIITELLGEDDFPASTELSSRLDYTVTRIEKDLKSNRNNLVLSNKQKSSMESKVTSVQNRIDEYEKKKSDMEKQIGSVTDDDLFADVDDLLREAKRERELCEAKYVEDQGSLYLWKKFRENLNEKSKGNCMADAAGCPVCERGFEDKKQLFKIIKKIDEIISKMPEQLSEYKENIKQNDARYDSLLQIKPLAVEVQQIENEHLPVLHSELSSLTEDLTKCHKKLDQEISTISYLESQEKLAKSISNDVAIISQTARQTQKMKREVDSLKMTINPILLEKNEEIFGRVDELIIEKETMQKKYKEIDENLDDLQTKCTGLISDERTAQDKVHKIKTQLMEAENENQSMAKFLEDSEKLSNDLRDVESKMKEIKNGSLSSAETSLKEKIITLKESTKEKNDSLNGFQTRIQEIKSCIRDMKRSRELLDIKQAAYEKLCHSSDIDKDLSQSEQTITILTEKMELKLAQVEEIKGQLLNHSLDQRSLEDCLELRRYERKLTEVHRRMLEEETKFSKIFKSHDHDEDNGRGTGDCSTEKLQERIRRLSVEEEKLREQRQNIAETITHVKAQIDLLCKDLKGKYASTEREYRETCYLQVSSQMTSTDLELFYKALDRAIMQHHSNKMEKINAILKNLWRTTYRGNDIDYIEIISEDDGTGLVKTRRTYNYRVVMVKVGSKEISTIAGRTNSVAKLDMRGRCSAGQKVLSSLVIRLALAEVFCIQCGVLALDEPTTNLDRANIESFAFALGEIIKTRASQENFQLLIITHDEDFVELMGRADFSEHFFALSRNDNGVSIIDKKRFDNHFF